MQISKQSLNEMVDFGHERLYALRDFYRMNFPPNVYPDGVSLAHFWHSYQRSAEYYHSNLTWLALSLLPTPDMIALTLRFAGQAMRLVGSEEFGDKITVDNVRLAAEWAKGEIVNAPRTTNVAKSPLYWAYHSAFCAQRVALNEFNTTIDQVHIATESARFARETAVYALSSQGEPQASFTAVVRCLEEQVNWAREALEAAGVWGGDNEQ